MFRQVNQLSGKDAVNERQIKAVLVALLCALFWLPPPTPAAAEAGSAGALRAKYQLHQARPPIQSSLPITIEAGQGGGRMRGDVYATLDYPYAQVVDTLRRGSNWCEIASLHLNVKACTHETRRDVTRLTFYSGRKHYQPPEASRPFIYEFRVQTHGPDYFRAVLTPDTVTRDTEQNQILVEAIPLGRDRVFLHVRYSFKYSLWMRLATGSYFATLGRDKTGFSVTGTDRLGRPVRATGIVGAVERNAVRYYLALQAYFSTLGVAGPDRYERRLSHWFDLTEQYAGQLREIGKAEYLSSKRRERAQQVRLQHSLDAASAAPPPGRR